MVEAARNAEMAKEIGAMEIEDWRTSDSRVLYLGLGGTGKEIVARVKAQFKAQGGGEVSPTVGFLVIDVNPDAPRTPDLQSVLSPAEMCHLSQGELPSSVQREIRRHVEQGTEFKWVGERIPPGEMMLEYDNFITGAERYRQAGLLAYLWEERRAGVTASLHNALEEVTAHARGAVSLRVFLICSICGGAGSGMLIDAAYLARSLGRDYSADSCDVSAVLVLPGAFRRVVDVPTYVDLLRNALATLTELDYFMYPRDQRGPRTCNPNNVNWSLRSAARAGQLLDTQEAIFQSVFLIDNQRNNGGTLGGPKVIFPAVADMLARLSGDLIGDRLQENLNNAKAGLRRHLYRRDNLGQDMPHYSSLGLARVILPIQKMAIEAAAVLSGDVLAKLQGGTEAPAEAAVAEAVRGLELEPAAMAQALGLARDEFVAGLAKAIDLRAPGAAGGRIAVVSQRVAEFARWQAPPDAIRRDCLETLDKARRAVIATQDQAQRRLSRRLAGSAESINKVLNDRMMRMRETYRGLIWFSGLLGKVIEATDKNLALAQQASASDRNDAAVRAEQEFQKAWDRLGNCPPGKVRQAAQAAAAMGDGWLGRRVDLVTAQMQERVFDDSLSRLRKIAEAAQSLVTLLGETLPAGTDRVVSALCEIEADEASVTDIRVTADGRKEYESAKSCAVREKMTADCLKDMTFEVLGGEQDCMRLRCAGDWLGDGSLLIGPSLQPFEATRDWIGYLAGRLKPFFAAQRLDDYITTDEEAGRYANACAKAAEVFVKYNPTMQLSEAGDPITITIAVAPADSRLDAAFSRPDTAWRGQFQGLVRAQGKDPTTALVLKAEIGILGKALQFRKDAATLEASMVSMPGLWTLGQLSHDLFWRNPDRWSGLELFFLGLATSRIQRRLSVGVKGATRFEYLLDLGHGQKARLGLGLQSAILGFLSPNNEAHRRRLWTDVTEVHMKEETDAALRAVGREYAKIAKQSSEVPSVAFRKVLEWRLRTLTEDPSAATPKETGPGRPSPAGGFSLEGGAAMEARGLTEGVSLSGARTSRVLLVGLGGTGKDILARVKRRLESIGGGTVPPHVGFLVVDVDPTPPETPDLREAFGPEELCCPAGGASPSQIRELIGREVVTGGKLAWLGERIPPGESVSDGADSGGNADRSRQAGLLAYQWEEARFGGVTHKLRESIARLTAVVRVAPEPVSPHVIIVSSACGGTGSGMFIDIAYLARSVVLDHAASCDVSGVLVLPDAFRPLVDATTYQSLERNAAATLAELDYFMVPEELRPTLARDSGDSTWPLRSGGRGGHPLDTGGAVFQSVFLVDRPTGERSDQWGSETVFQVIAEALSYLSGNLIGEPFLGAMNGARGTLRRFARAQDPKGVWSYYGGLGLARIVLPVRRMALEAADLLSKDVSARLIGGSEPPSEAVVAGLLGGLGIEPEELGRALDLERNELLASLAGVIGLNCSVFQLEKTECLSRRLAEILRQAAPPEVLRRQCLDVLGKANATVAAALDQTGQTSPILAGSLADTLRDALGRQLTQVWGSDHGIEWLGKLVARLADHLGARLASAEQAMAGHRVDAVERSRETARAAQSRLDVCPASEVRRAAIAAARTADAWVGERVDLATGQMEERVLRDSLSTLRRIGDSVHSLLGLLVDVLPRETGQLVASLREKNEALPTDIQVQADGQATYQAVRHAPARAIIVAACLERLSVTLDGDAVRISDGFEGASLLEAGSDPAAATERWIEYVATRLETYFASVPLDECVTTDEAAKRLAAAGLRAAQVLLDYDRASQRGEAGDPIRATFVVAPGGSRLGRALVAASPPGLVHLGSKDPTQVVILQAEVGIAEKALRFKEDAATAEADLPTTLGVWTMGQLSHSLFWHDSQRWSSLGLFFQAWAGSHVMRQEIPPRLRGPETPGHEYWLDCGQGRVVSLGRGLQASVLKFAGPACAEDRERLERELRSTTRAEAATRAVVLTAPGLAELVEDPCEVPSVAFRKVLRLRLKGLTDGAPATESADSGQGAAGPSGRHS